MKSLKRSYWLPTAVAERFEQSVPAGQRSAVVSRIMNDWLEADDRKHLRADIIEGCLEMAELSLEIEKEFHPLDEEVERKYGGYGPETGS